MGRDSRAETKKRVGSRNGTAKLSGSTWLARYMYVQRYIRSNVPFFLSFRERVDFPISIPSALFRAINRTSTPFATSSTKRKLPTTRIVGTKVSSWVHVHARLLFPFRLIQELQEGPRCLPVVRVDRKCGEECWRNGTSVCSRRLVSKYAIK